MEPKLSLVKDARQLFSECLEQVMRRRDVFHPVMHTYLVNLLNAYVQWHKGETLLEEGKKPRADSQGVPACRFDDLKPSVNPGRSSTFALVLYGFQENPAYLSNAELRRMRLQSTADTLLVSIGYYPESIADKLNSARPNLDYYIGIGRSAYSKAAALAARRTAREGGLPDVLTELSERFIGYAAVLYLTRHELGDRPVTNVKLMAELSKLFSDKTVLQRYVLSVTPDNKLIIN